MSRWRYENKTTGRELECGDLAFLLHRIKTQHGLMLPEGAAVTMMLWGVVELTVLDTDGVLNHFVIYDELREEVAQRTLNAIH